MSFGLTQYDMEELMAHTGEKCESSLFGGCCTWHAWLWMLDACGRWHLALFDGSIGWRAVTQDEIEALYSRFRALDRSSKVWEDQIQIGLSSF